MSEEKKEAEAVAPTTVATQREPLIELKDKKVNIKVLVLSMSTKFKWLLLFDMFVIAWIPSIFTYVFAVQASSTAHMVGVATIGALLLIVSVLKTFADLRNWVFTMNKYLMKLADWYVEDVKDIVTDLLNAGARFAEEEVAKATGKEVPKEKENEIASESEKKD